MNFFSNKVNFIFCTRNIIVFKCTVLYTFTPSTHPLQNRISSRSSLVAVTSSNRDQTDGSSIDDAPKNPSSRLTTFAQVLLERSNTLKIAGFYDDHDETDKHHHHQQQQQQLEPVYAGFKTNIMLFLAAVGYKWYRFIFINKVRVPMI